MKVIISHFSVVKKYFWHKKDKHEDKITFSVVSQFDVFLTRVVDQTTIVIEVGNTIAVLIIITSISFKSQEKQFKDLTSNSLTDWHTFLQILVLRI